MSETASPYELEMRAKYTEKEIEALGKEGKAFKSPDGHYSYPISDENDLKKAIKAVGRGGADHDAIRKYVIGRARALKLSDLIPDSWAADGSLKESESAWDTTEKRETANNVFMGLEGALCDIFEEQYGRWSVWVQDWDGESGEGDGYRVIYQLAGDLFAAAFSYDDDGKITVDTEGAVKVRPITSYIERAAPVKEQRTAAWAAKERRKVRAQLLDKTQERRRCVPGLDVREASDGLLKVGGCASVVERAYEVLGWEETIVRGAFKRTLSEGPDVVYLANHEGMPLARTTTNSLTLGESRRGDLDYDADLQSHDPDVIQLRPKLERGDMNESSFAFRVREQEWDADYRKRRILDVGLHKGDVSTVNFGANDSTTSSLRALQTVGFDRLSEGLRELRAGKALSTTNEDALTRVLELVAAADEAVDEAQPVLARVLGVPNPDKAQDAELEAEEEKEAERAIMAPSYAAIARARRAMAMVVR